MADFKAIMTLAVAGRSYDEIVARAGSSRRDVASAKKTIAAYGFTAGQIGAMSPQEIARLFPDGRKRVTESYERPDFEHRERREEVWVLTVLRLVRRACPGDLGTPPAHTHRLAVRPGLLG